MAIPTTIKTLLSGNTVEWARIEFKTNWDPAASLKTIGAFANDIDNCGGGYIVIGVSEENGLPKKPLTGVASNQLDAWQKDIYAKCKLMRPEYTPIIGIEENALLENARRYCKTHPFLYKQILDNENPCLDSERKLQIGLEAMDRISENYVVRGEIALLTAKYANDLRRFDVEDDCILEAFRSDSSALNYLRLRFLVRDPDKYKSARLNIIEKHRPQEEENALSLKAIDTSPNKENSVSVKRYCIFMFWEGLFDEMYKTGMNTKEYLGWTFTFMKEGISFMLLAMYRGDDMQSGMKDMFSRVLSACGFSSGEYFI